MAESGDSDDISSDLNLSVSFSPFESGESEQQEMEEVNETIEPYQFEPLASDSSSVESMEDDGDAEDRLHNTNWLD